MEQKAFILNTFYSSSFLFFLVFGQGKYFFYCFAAAVPLFRLIVKIPDTSL
jgi:hypothetical protein